MTRTRLFAAPLAAPWPAAALAHPTGEAAHRARRGAEGGAMLVSAGRALGSGGARPGRAATRNPNRKGEDR